MFSVTVLSRLESVLHQNVQWPAVAICRVQARNTTMNIRSSALFCNLEIWEIGSSDVAEYDAFTLVVTLDCNTNGIPCAERNAQPPPHAPQLSLHSGVSAR